MRAVRRMASAPHRPRITTVSFDATGTLFRLTTGVGETYVRHHSLAGSSLMLAGARRIATRTAGGVGLITMCANALPRELSLMLILHSHQHSTPTFAWRGSSTLGPGGLNMSL